MKKADENKHAAPTIRVLANEERDAAKGDASAKKSQPGSQRGLIRC